MNIRKKPLYYSIFTITSISIISKLAGFLREGMIAYNFGTTIYTDIYYLLYGVFATFIAAIGSSIGIAYLPIFVSNIKQIGVQVSLQKAMNLLIQLFLIGLIISLLLYLFSDLAAKLLAPTYNQENLFTLSKYLKIFSVGSFFLMASYLLSAILNAQRKFFISEFGGMSYSIVTIIAIIFFSSIWGIDALIYAVPISALLQFSMLFLLVFKKVKFLCEVESIFFSQENRKVYLSVLPILLGSGTIYLGLSIDKIIASSLSIGSVSALSYAGVIHSVVNVLFITSVVNVFFTEFSQKLVDNDIKGLLQIWKKGITMLYILLVPISVFFVLYSSNIITILLKRGQFTQQSVELTALSLSFYVLGTPFYAIRDLTTRVFYAQKNTKTPMINGIMTLVLNVLLSYFLSRVLGVGGITFASALVSLISCAFLIYFLSRKLTINFNTFIPTFFKVMISAIFLILVLLCTRAYLSSGVIVLDTIISFTIGFSIYMGSLYCLKCEEIVFYANKLIKKLII
jgi:putative peptidoglycan lipid II flippase